MKNFLLFTALGLIMILTSCEQQTVVENESIEQSSSFDLQSIIVEAQNEVAGSKIPVGPLTTVDYVDPARYVGQWFELANIPNMFSQDCSCTTANYTLTPQGIGVFNECTLLSNGNSNGINGLATIADAQTNSKLNLFFGPVQVGTYWIIDLVEFDKDAPYDFAVVSDANRQNLFLLSRTQKITTFKQRFALLRILINMVRQGFDITELQVTPQLDSCAYPMD